MRAQTSTRPIVIFAALISCFTAVRVAASDPGSPALRPAADASAAIKAVALERGQAIARQAFSVLSSNLTNAIAAGGISNALPYCAVMAVPLTTSVAATNRVELRRVSHRPRNPKNKANAEEMTHIARGQAEVQKGRRPTPVVLDSGGDTVTFLAPIVLGHTVCLQCHGQPGEDIQPQNLALIRRLYPQDQATGFRLGDLRGMWRIEFRKADLATAK